MTARPPASYRTWLFDCDGVLLDSNPLKTAAFAVVGQRYGHEVVAALVDHHQRNAGVSRFAKIDHLFSAILERTPRDGEVDDLVDLFTSHVRTGLDHVTADPDAATLLQLIATAGGHSFVVSGGHEPELKDTLARRGLTAHLAGVHGSPRTKRQIVDDLRTVGALVEPVVFVGDSRLDLATAQIIGADFVFVTHWTELADWRDVLPLDDIAIVPSLGAIVCSWSGDDQKLEETHAP